MREKIQYIQTTNGSIVIFNPIFKLIIRGLWSTKAKWRSSIFRYNIHNNKETVQENNGNYVHNHITKK